MPSTVGSVLVAVKGASMFCLRSHELTVAKEVRPCLFGTCKAHSPGVRGEPTSREDDTFSTRRHLLLRTGSFTSRRCSACNGTEAQSFACALQLTCPRQLWQTKRLSTQVIQAALNPGTLGGQLRRRKCCLAL